MYKCGHQGCEKAYGTLNHLNAHVTMQSHGQKRTPEGMFSSLSPITVCFVFVCSPVAFPPKWFSTTSVGLLDARCDASLVTRHQVLLLCPTVLSTGLNRALTLILVYYSSLTRRPLGSRHANYHLNPNTTLSYRHCFPILIAA